MKAGDLSLLGAGHVSHADVHPRLCKFRFLRIAAIGSDRKLTQ